MMSALSLNPSAILQGSVTFVLSVLWVETFKDVVIVAQQSEPHVVLRIKILSALLATIIVVLLLHLVPTAHAPAAPPQPEPLPFVGGRVVVN